MRTILVASCLLLTALSLVPSASADDQQCRILQNQVQVCHSLADLNDDHSCATVQVGSGGSDIGACVRYGNGYVCPVAAGGVQNCLAEM